MDKEVVTNYIIGMMSGSSLDGLDIAYFRLEEEDDRIAWDLLAAETLAIPNQLQDLLREWKDLDASSFINLESEFSIFVSDVLNEFIEKHVQDLDLIVSHGHTLLHLPDQSISVQIGNGGVISSKTGYPVLCDLRIQDVAQGGQGAPLAALVDYHLFSQYTYSLNLGGIANLSMHSDDRLKAFDICAANQVLNHLAQQKGLSFDDKGEMARSGKCLGGFYEKLDHSFYEQMAPKSLDNSWVNREVIQILPKASIEDLLHSYCHFIAQQIKASIRREDKDYEGKTMLVAGGGTKNDFLIDCIRETLAPLGVFVYEANDDVVDYKESLLMALMGFLFLHQQKNLLAEATGGALDLSAGAFYQGSKFPYLWTESKEY